MLQIAVFVDAGYLYAQGSALISGQGQQPRIRTRLNVGDVIRDLVEEARSVEPNARLLRIYWYDGLARGGVLNIEQRSVAESENVKVRFGTINGRGEQKGVDSLIVTDLIELSRTHAISDALILSGDEDIRVGVQVAQTFGIRVHLLGIQPARGSQSPDLIAESDTHREWERNKVGGWLTLAQESENSPPPIVDDQELAWIDTIVAVRVNPLSIEQAKEILQFVEANRNMLPPDFDRPSLGIAKGSLARELTNDERKSFRFSLLEAIRTKAQ